MKKRPEIRREMPECNELLRRSLYEGDIFLLAPTEASLRYVEVAKERLASAFFDVKDPRRAHEEISAKEFFVRIGEVRRELYLDESYHKLIVDLVEGHGFSPDQVAFDPARLRTISHEGHKNPAAAPVYYGHRDTWYGHPPGLITWWIPLDDLREEETFLFYPDKFGAPVPNDSEMFDYDEWVSRGESLKIGWQDPEAGKNARYPGVIGDFDAGPALGFSCCRGENLLFSGAHYHRTREQSLGTTRFSLDFRIVDLGDYAAGRGAPDVDNRSRGSAVGDYVRCSSAAGPLDDGERLREV